MRAFDADKLLDILDVMIVGHKSASDVYDVVDSMPTIDPVKHGHWIVNDNRHTCRCSCCESVELTDWALEEAKYCPNCGAYMGGGRWQDWLMQMS